MPLKVAIFVGSALARQIQQSLQPGAQLLARQAQVTAAFLPQKNVRRQLQGVACIGAQSGKPRLALHDARKLRQQFGQQRQNVAARAIDVHAQRQAEKG